MIDQAQTDKLQEILGSSKQGLVIFPGIKDLDLFLASYCLFSHLSKQLKIRLLSSKKISKLPPTISGLVNLDLLEIELGKENLLISFPYREEQVDKVSYYISEHDQRFYLTIKPKHGVDPLDSNQVEFAYAGAGADLLFLCGVDSLDDLQQLYFGYENLYQSSNSHLVTLNNFIPDFGTLALDMSEASSYCEAAYFILRDLAVGQKKELVWLDSNLASLLLYGIESKTQALQNDDLTSETFLAVGELMKLGAKRLFKKELVKTAIKKTRGNSNGSRQHHLIK